MEKAKIFVLTTLADWWGYMLGAIAATGTLYALVRRIRADQLKVITEENNALKKHVAALMLEATIRIDNERDHLVTIDGLQRKVTEQRKAINELLDRSDRSNPPSLNS